MKKYISWTYTHSLNSKSKTRITKYGKYLWLVKHNCRYKGPQLAWVHFIGNKRFSRIPYEELIFY